MRLTLLTALLVLPAAGCSDGKSVSLPSPVEAGGKVTFASGQPVKDVRVFFATVDAMAPASGKVNADGTFQLSTYDEKPGAVPGKYRVIFRVNTGATNAETNASQAALKLIPAKYTEDNSPLEVEIPRGGNTNIELKLDAK